MQHYHFDSLPSTQTHLLEHLESNPNSQIVVSCDNQTSGIGRRGNEWIQLGEGLFVSFVSSLCDIPTLTALEVSVQIVEFFKNKYSIDLKLKWPNDILTNDSKKCGGVIINAIDKKAVIGVGLNLYSNTETAYDYPSGDLFNSSRLINKEQLALDLATYMIESRLTAKQIISKWNWYCCHLELDVTIADGENITSGLFKGVGSDGQALVEGNNQIKSVYNGSLRF